MINKVQLENRRIQFLVLAVGCFIAIFLGPHLTAFTMAFVPDAFIFNDFFMRFLPATIGYGCMGFLLGYGAWNLLEKNALALARFMPLIMLVVYNIQVYINFVDRDGSYDPFGLMGYLLTSLKGYSLLIVVPVGYFLTVKYFEAKSLKN